MYNKERGIPDIYKIYIEKYTYGFGENLKGS